MNEGDRDTMGGPCRIPRGGIADHLGCVLPALSSGGRETATPAVYFSANGVSRYFEASSIAPRVLSLVAIASR